MGRGLASERSDALPSLSRVLMARDPRAGLGAYSYKVRTGTAPRGMQSRQFNLKGEGRVPLRGRGGRRRPGPSRTDVAPWENQDYFSDVLMQRMGGDRSFISRAAQMTEPGQTAGQQADAFEGTPALPRSAVGQSFSPQMTEEERRAYHQRWYARGGHAETPSYYNQPTGSQGFL